MKIFHKNRLYRNMQFYSLILPSYCMCKRFGFSMCISLYERCNSCMYMVVYGAVTPLSYDILTIELNNKIKNNFCKCFLSHNHYLKSIAQWSVTFSLEFKFCWVVYNFYLFKNFKNIFLVNIVKLKNFKTGENIFIKLYFYPH